MHQRVLGIYNTLVVAPAGICGWPLKFREVTTLILFLPCMKDWMDSMSNQSLRSQRSRLDDWKNDFAGHYTSGNSQKHRMLSDITFPNNPTSAKAVDIFASFLPLNLKDPQTPRRLMFLPRAVITKIQLLQYD